MYIKIVIFHVIKKKLEYKNSLFRVTIEITVKKVAMQIISRTCTLYTVQYWYMYCSVQNIKWYKNREFLKLLLV